MMGTHPTKVVATGGAVWRPREELYGNIYDHISSDFTYANGMQMSSYCRQFDKAKNQKIATNISERVVGTKGSSNCKDMGAVDINPYVREHTAMARSIRGEGLYINHGIAVAESTMTCTMANRRTQDKRLRGIRLWRRSLT